MKFFLALMLSTAIYSFSLAASHLGGFMSECYTGQGFQINKICSSSQVADQTSTMKVFAQAQSSYLDQSGSTAKVKVDLWINDYKDFFNPDSQVPVIVRAIVCGFHRNCQYQVINFSNLTATRINNEQTLHTDFSLQLNNVFGAEYVETLEKIEVLIPGVGKTFVLSF